MSETWIRAIVLVCTFGAVVLLAETLISAFVANHSIARAMNLRLQMIGQGHSRAETLNFLRRQPGDIAGKLPPILGPIAAKFERLIMASQIRAPIGRIVLVLLLSPIALFLGIIFMVIVSGGGIGFGRIVLIATFAGVVGFALPLMVLQFKAARTRRKMQEQFPVALDVFVRGLRAGHPIAAALDLLTVEMTDPIGSQFGTVVDEVTYGADLRDALQAMAERWDMEEMRMFVVSLSVQAETGGNLAEILENLASVIRERASMMMKVRALSSEGRMTAVMLSVLPLLAFASLFLLNPSFYLDVSDDPIFVPGFVALMLLYAVGFFTIRKMVDLKV